MQTLALLAALTLAIHPADAISLGAQDATALNGVASSRMTYQRYLILDETTKEHAGAVALGINLAMNRSRIRHLPAWTGQDQRGRWLLRLDLEKLARDDADLTKLLAVWEKLADFDPWLHNRQLATVPPYRASDGKIYNVRLRNDPSLAYNLEEHLLLVSLCQTRAPILRADWFLGVALSTINKTPASPGLYYEFQRYPRKHELPKHKTEQAAWLELFGSSEELVRNLDGDARSIVMCSQIAGAKQRRSDLFFGLGSSPTDGPAFISITHDLKDASARADKLPLLNLLKDVDDAREAIAQDPLQHYALFNNKGEFQVEVPPDIATDHTVPAPYTKRLEIFGCVRCHGPDSGWKPYENDFRKMLDAGFDVVDDLGIKDQREAVRQIAAKFRGQPAVALQKARDDYEIEVFGISGMRTPEAHRHLSDFWGKYWYKTHGPARALDWILGRKVEKEQAIAEFEKAFPRLGPEDPVIGALRAGIDIVTADLERIAPDLALRGRAQELALKGGGP